MKNYQKVVWAEGALLGQQHFQQWDNFHHARYVFLLQAIAPSQVGLQRLVIDDAGLQNGQLIIKQCQAIFPHGLIIDYDNRYAPPLACQLYCQPHETSVAVFLATPISPQVSNIAGYPAANSIFGWIGEYCTVPDESDPLRERELLLARPHLQLLCQLALNFDPFWRGKMTPLKDKKITVLAIHFYHKSKSFLSHISLLQSPTNISCFQNLTMMRNSIDDSFASLRTSK